MGGFQYPQALVGFVEHRTRQATSKQVVQLIHEKSAVFDLDAEAVLQNTLDAWTDIRSRKEKFLDVASRCIQEAFDARCEMPYVLVRQGKDLPMVQNSYYPLRGIQIHG